MQDVQCLVNKRLSLQAKWSQFPNLNITVRELGRTKNSAAIVAERLRQKTTSWFFVHGKKNETINNLDWYHSNQKQLFGSYVSTPSSINNNNDSNKSQTKTSAQHAWSPFHIQQRLLYSLLLPRKPIPNSNQMALLNTFVSVTSHQCRRGLGWRTHRPLVGVSLIKATAAARPMIGDFSKLWLASLARSLNRRGYWSVRVTVADRFVNLLRELTKRCVGIVQGVFRFAIDWWCGGFI